MEVQQIALINMDGKNRIIILILLFLSICNCKNQVKSNVDGRELINQNINILIDSIEGFDMSNILMPNGQKNLNIKKISVSLLDTVCVESTNLKNKSSAKFQNLNISKNEISKFKTNYKINLTKVRNDCAEILFVKFYNFEINKNYANITVKKIIGISMIENIYYFKKINNIWVFKRKKFQGMG